MEKIRVGVVGVGYFGRFHAEKYAKIPEVELVGVADIDATRAQEVAARHSTKHYVDYRDLINQVQAVSIAVPTPIHYQVARDFVDNDIDVLLEKPMTIDLREAEDLIGVVERKRLILQIGHLERFNSAVTALNSLLGTPLFIDSIRFSPYLERASQVDVVLDLMIHDIDIILSMVRSDVMSIHAVGVPVVSSHLDVANARMEFRNGCVANISANRVSREKIRQIRIFQADGHFTIDFLSQKIRALRRKHEVDGPRIVSEEIEIDPADALEAEIRSFVQRVKDRRPPLVSGENGKRALEVALAITDQIEKNIASRKNLDSVEV